MSKQPAILWFRRDLRLGDNPALTAAVNSGRPLICLYIDETNAPRREGGAKQVWLHHSLTSLAKDLKACGASLILRQGNAKDILDEIIDQTNAEAVFWNRRYEAFGIETDKALKADFKSRGLTVETFNGSLLTEPWEIAPKSGGDFYKIFTPYWRAACEVIGPRMNQEGPLDAPGKINGYSGDIASDDLSFLPKGLDWDEKIMTDWSVGEKAASQKLKRFLEKSVSDYAEERNIPSNKTGTSRLSPHLAAGEISPRQIWDAARESNKNVDVFLSEIGWREFSYVLLFHNPKLASENYKEAFNKFDWAKDDAALTAWQNGQTGYPFVDAGLRELYQTGWMHNRVRMVVASFLIKHLLIDWRKGEDWFWDCLLEADPAANAASWQWVAGSGADASPYFRIFNPFSQGEKFDKTGDYVREFVPELKKLPDKYIHTPWKAPQNVLDYAGVKLGETYPKPLVDHKFARERALSEYKKSRGE